MDFSQITNQTLDNLDLGQLSNYINSQEYREYFLSFSGREHYRLLHWISQTNQNQIILDIGTLKGCSALALSSGHSNSVKSFNISNQLDLNKIPENVEFIIGDILDSRYESLVLSSSYILLDTFHDGTFEKQFVDYLSLIHWKGHLLLDDIYLNNEMKNFWNSLNGDKTDLTSIGHITGTGLVIFS